MTGAALALVYPPALKSIATWFRRGRGTALGVMVGALTVGSATPHLVNGFGGLDWRSVVLTTSLLTLAGGLLAEIAGRDGPFPFPPAVFDPTQARQAFANRGVRLASLGYFGHMWELYAMWAWFSVFAADVFADGGAPCSASRHCCRSGRHRTTEAQPGVNLCATERSIVGRRRLVVIGGDAAGMSAASQARRRRKPDDLEIVAFERGCHTSYSACGIPYLVGGVVGDPEELVARAPETFRSRYAIDVHLRHEVLAVDLERRAVRVADLDGGRVRWEPFDELMVATGSVPVWPNLPGATAAGIRGVQTLDDGVELLRILVEEQPRRVVVVGGGYIGLEMAEALVMRGLEVALVEAGPQPMATLDPDMGALVADALRGVGVSLYTEERAVGFDSEGGRVRAVVTGQRTLPADLVVLGLGVRPNSALAADAGIPVGPTTGGIVTDRRMHTAAEGVWAAGDCVESFHLVSRRPVVIALGTHANKQGRVAGINIGGGYATFPGVLGTAVSKICGIEIARTGLSEAEAARAGLEWLSVVVESTTRAGYYPGAKPMKTKIIAEKRSGRLLGAQIVGEENAAKRIDGLAIAAWNGMTVEEMTGLDLSYAPPFSPVWDPVLIAARKAAERIEETMAECR